MKEEKDQTPPQVFVAGLSCFIHKNQLQGSTEMGEARQADEQQPPSQTPSPETYPYVSGIYTELLRT